jgi:hypothetical protein
LDRAGLGREGNGRVGREGNGEEDRPDKLQRVAITTVTVTVTLKGGQSSTLQQSLSYASACIITRVIQGG